MDYEKKKVKALEELKQCDRYDIEPAKTILKIFPELEESDYVIKQRLIHLLGYFRSRGIDHDLCDRILKWLEKQGEQKSNGKVEPKFKVGDWITDGEYIWKVTDIRRLDYILQSQNGDTVDDIISYVDEQFRLWTIQDAKDGDVLVTMPSNGSNQSKRIFIFKKIIDSSHVKNAIDYYCQLFNNKFMVKSEFGYIGETIDDFAPATKEQCETLFELMYKAGYEWDANKKELKKIEKNSAWSEDDELNLKQAIYVCHQNEYTAVENWLKSLKPQFHWKPTEEQMETLKETIEYDAVDANLIVLKSLYDNLKNL